MVTFLENRAYAAVAVVANLQRKKARLQWRGRRTQDVAVKLGGAKREEARAVALAADVATLLQWLREDVLSVAGPDHATRRDLFDFLVAELRCREPLCPHRIGPVVRALANQRDDLLAFASQLDRDLEVLAAEFQIPVDTARAVLNVELLPLDDPSRWRREAALRSQLGSRHFSLRVATGEVGWKCWATSASPATDLAPAAISPRYPFRPALSVRACYPRTCKTEPGPKFRLVHRLAPSKRAEFAGVVRVVNETEAVPAPT